MDWAESIVVLGHVLGAWLLVRRLSGRGGSPHALAIVRAALGIGLGAGFASAGFAVGLIAFGPDRMPRLVVEGALVAAAVAWLARHRGDEATPARDLAAAAQPSRLVAALFWIAVASSLAALAMRCLQQPQGGFDAVSIWNMRARSLYLCGEDWRAAFQPASFRPHVDYPLLVPALVARLMRCAGGDYTLVPMAVAFAATLATIGLLGGGLALFGGRGRCMAGMTICLGIVYFVRLGSEQYADVPLALFVLGAVVSLALAQSRDALRPGGLALAGLCIGAAGWTKNEGVLLGLAFGAAAVVMLPRAIGWRGLTRAAGWFAAGCLPFVCTIALFKLLVAAENDVVAPGRLREIGALLLDPERYATVLRGVVWRTWETGKATVPAFLTLAIAARILRPAPPPTVALWLRLALAALAFGWLAYLVPYVVTYREPMQHLRTSYDRLLLHLWPASVFALVVWMPDLWKAPSRTGSAGPDSCPAA